LKRASLYIINRRISSSQKLCFFEEILRLENGVAKFKHAERGSTGDNMALFSATISHHRAHGQARMSRYYLQWTLVLKASCFLILEISL
jgi:hypothetical protein